MSVPFEVEGSVYELPKRQAEILAENLRGFAAGNYPDTVRELNPDESWLESARQAADWIETWLVEEPDAPISLEAGRAAEAMYEAMRPMFINSADPAGALGLRETLTRLLDR